MAWFSLNKSKNAVELGATSNVPSQQNDSNYRSFSTPFGEIGSGNLSLPYVSSNYQQNGFVRFGTDNLYPQLLNQIYSTSPIHGSCIDFITNSVIGGGYEFNIKPTTGIEAVALLTFETRNKFKKLAKLLTRDFIIHKRICVVVNRDEFGNFISFKRLDPSTIRHNQDNTRFGYSNDYSRGMVTKEYDRYSAKSKVCETLYVYQDETPGQDIYAIPRYNSILNWAFLDSEQSFLQKSNIKNSIWPSLIIRNPKTFQSVDEVETFKAGIKNNKGAANAGNVLVLSGSGMEEVPEVVIPSTNQNDKLFETTSKDIKENICIAHTINPCIMGVKTQGQLGATTEIQDSYLIYEENVVYPNRNEMNDILNELLHISGIKNTLTINDYKVIKPIVDPNAPVATATPEDIKLANELETSQPTVNESLKGLSAKENMDIIRIVRDYDKGKLNEPLAITRLGSYGIDEVTAKSILGL